MEICKEEKCTGCSACANVCPTETISMLADDRGFLRPVVDDERCIMCHRCVRTCPQNKAVEGNIPLSVYAALSKNEVLRENSSSGGIFSLLAEATIKKGGVVFGASYDDDLTVKHIAVTSIEGLEKLRGSKYVQSQIGQSYKEAKTYLENEKPVLFSGTPCQISGLKSFLGKTYKKLLTIDVLCHGVPSPAIFQLYANDLKLKYKKSIVNVRFRNKTLGWKKYSTQLIFADGSSINLEQDPFVNGFLKNLYLRESCHQCSFASSERVGDITLGDFWGYCESAPYYVEDDDRGISLLLVNTSAGKSAYKHIHKQVVIAPRKLEDARRGNKILSESFPKPEQAEKFWECYHNYTWKQLCDTFELGDSAVQDFLNSENRIYSEPFHKRRLKHVFCRYKEALIRKLKGK